jgi:hypothetical protein
MNSMITYNARRIAQTEARVNEILDYIRDNPKATQKTMLKTLARRWRVSVKTAQLPLQWMKRHGMIESQVEIVTRLKVKGVNHGI